MINISVLFNQLIMLFLIICTGYLAYKLQYFDELTNKKLNKLVVNITYPDNNRFCFVYGTTS